MSDAQKYRKRPLIVEAVQYDGMDAPGFAEAHGLECLVSTGVGDHPIGMVVIVRTDEGDMRILPGEWLITGIAGEKYTCKPDIFEATYEPLLAMGRAGSAMRPESEGDAGMSADEDTMSDRLVCHPIMQTAFGDPDGNCLEACFASITGIPLAEIPHYLNSGWYGSYCRWLLGRGWQLDYWTGGLEVAPAGLAIASGPAVRGLAHSTIYLDGHLYHDPHPSGAGLESVEDWMSLVRLEDTQVHVAAPGGLL